MFQILKHCWKFMKHYDSYLNNSAPDYKLTRNEKDILLFLHNNPRFDTAVDIVQYRSISKSLVAKSVSSLTARGFLSQSVDTTDGRYIHLTITPEASGAVTELKNAQYQFLKRCGEGLTKDEQQQLLALIGRLETHLNDTE